MQLDPIGDPGSDGEVYLQISFMVDGVPGHEDPDLSPLVDRNIKRRPPPLRFNNFQRSMVVYETAGAARGPLAMVIISLYY